MSLNQNLMTQRPELVQSRVRNQRPCDHDGPGIQTRGPVKHWCFFFFFLSRPQPTSAQWDAVSGVVARLDAVTTACRHGNSRSSSSGGWKSRAGIIHVLQTQHLTFWSQNSKNKSRWRMLHRCPVTGMSAARRVLFNKWLHTLTTYSNPHQLNALDVSWRR